MDHPVRGLRKVQHPRLGAEGRAGLGQAGLGEVVLVAPDHQGRRGQAPGSGDRQGLAEQRPIPVQHGGDGARLRPGRAIRVQDLSPERLGPDRALERLDQRLEVPAPDHQLRQERQAQHLDIAALLPLFGVLRHRLQPDGRMRRIEDRQPFQPPGMLGRRPPGHRGAPVVTHQAEPVETAGVGQGDHVPGQGVQPVGADALRLVAEIVAPLVRRDHPEPGLGQGPDQLPPAVPELREAVQEDHRRPIGRARLHHMQRHLARLDLPMRQLNHRLEPRADLEQFREE